jgi:plastocyanin
VERSDERALTGEGAMGRVLMAIIVAVALVVAISSDTRAQNPTTHNIFVSLIEVKGGTTVDKLQPPPQNPKDLSKGYEFKGPGVADKSSPHRWEVSTYMFAPAFMTVRQGDEVVLTAFVVNGDEHEVWINAPDGTTVVPRTKWSRGREYQARFVAERSGPYQLLCSGHAPTMTATVFALPR